MSRSRFALVVVVCAVSSLVVWCAAPTLGVSRAFRSDASDWEIVSVYTDASAGAAPITLDVSVRAPSDVSSVWVYADGQSLAHVATPVSQPFSKLTVHAPPSSHLEFRDRSGTTTYWETDLPAQAPSLKSVGRLVVDTSVPSRVPWGTTIEVGGHALPGADGGPLPVGAPVFGSDDRQFDSGWWIAEHTGGATPTAPIQEETVRPDGTWTSSIYVGHSLPTAHVTTCFIEEQCWGSPWLLRNDRTMDGFSDQLPPVTAYWKPFIASDVWPVKKRFRIHLRVELAEGRGSGSSDWRGTPIRLEERRGTEWVRIASGEVSLAGVEYSGLVTPGVHRYRAFVDVGVMKNNAGTNREMRVEAGYSEVLRVKVG